MSAAGTDGATDLDGATRPAAASRRLFARGPRGSRGPVGPGAPVGPGGRATVQVWFNVVLGAMVLLVVVFAVIGAQLLSRTSEISDTLSQQVQPARVEGVRLQAALLDQETGVRGFVLTHDDQFLTPYTEGLRDEQAVAARLRTLISGNDRALGDLDALQSVARAWRDQYAEPLVAHSRQGRPTAADSRMLEGSKQAFDGIRARYAAEDRHLLADRVAGQAQLRHVNGQRDAVFLAMLASFLMAALVLALLLRQIVGRPLVKLRDSALKVAGGDFGSRIEAGGPADLRVVAAAVESMRVNLAGALAEAHDQRVRLSGQADELTAQAEELRRSNSELEQFAYVASHDLQEPLRKVASFCQLLDKRYHDQLDERGAQYIQFAVDGAKRMQILITDLLAFSRVGRTQDDRLPVRLDAALDSALANLAGVLEESGARVVRPAALPGVIGDPTLLTMVWQNLIGNAVKFASADTPALITIETGTGPDGESTFSVTDNGIGIPAEFSEKVFVIFQRLHSRDVYDGTGIGLALCRKIVEHHGGRIALDTSYTGGTRILFTLPAAPDPERSDATATRTLPATPATPTASAVPAGPGDRPGSDPGAGSPDEGAHPA